MAKSLLMEVVLLGEGSFGQTFLVHDLSKRFGAPLLVMKIPKDSTGVVDDDIKNEINTLIRLAPHSNVVKLLGIEEFRGHACIVMEHVNGGNLRDPADNWSKAFRSGREQQILEAEAAIRQICLGLKHIHDKQVIHRDLKLENILYEDGGEGILIKICDFGLSRTFKADDWTTVGGTLPYMAPETLEGTYSYSTDIYALGAIIYRIITGKFPLDFGDCRDSTEKKEVIRTERPQTPDKVIGRAAGTLGDIAAKCLEKSPEARYGSIDDILRALPTATPTQRSPAPPSSAPATKPPDITEAIKEKLSGCGITIDSEKSIEYGIQLVARLGGEKNNINIYTGKKGTKVIVGGKQGALFQQLQEIHKELGIGASAQQRKASPAAALPPLPAPPWIGTDESGKGDYFGPLVIAGAYVEPSLLEVLHELGIRDSKRLSDKRIRLLAGQIRRLMKKEHFAVVEIKPETYNKLYAEFRNEGKNLNTLLAWGHARAIEDIISMQPCETVIADQFGDESYIKSKLLKSTKDQRVNLIQRHKAEANIAVATASILARDRYLDWLERAFKEWGEPLPKGASNLVLEAAKRFSKCNGHDNLVKVAKLHFKTTQRI